MTTLDFNRRAVLGGLCATGFTMAVPALAATGPLMQVVKDPNCGCCGAWINVMASAGFDVKVRDVPYDDLVQLKADSGISDEMASCHTAHVDGYIIEGHVPAPDIERLLAERPDAIGLAVPGMPWGSPGMGPENKRDAYTVYLIRKDGSVETFTEYEAA
ncbi:Protein of unknown function, DUF [Nereida ignava]|uniref:Metal-binding protein n=1 Tax=Nereida ignava TaxID=282199 RepID=A0A0U1NJ63_9RHOB|nr:DUF411 domain-containing protein [Nereida ignava]CRK74760.1 Protein of unknown function, DUF [Nereida ignava]SFJ87938.1 Uncharacterized conserved protein [Nereida ignava DSM 16309]